MAKIMSHLTSSKRPYIDNCSTWIFRAGECWRGQKPLERFDRQPLPDFKLWVKMGELHYMGFEERRDFPVGPWDECPGLFLSEKVLSPCFRVLPQPSKGTMKSIAFLAWMSPDEASAYFNSMHGKLQAHKNDDMKRETWKHHPFYQESEETLVKMCSESKLFPSGKKHELVQRIVQNHPSKEDEAPCLEEVKLYDGKIEFIPNSSAGLMFFFLLNLLRKPAMLGMGRNFSYHHPALFRQQIP